MTHAHPNRLHAARVALSATAVVVACYAVCALALGLFVAHRLTGEADTRISSRLAYVERLDLAAPSASVPVGSGADSDPDDAPIFSWRVDAKGAAKALTLGGPTLPRHAWSATPVTLTIGSTPFRLDAVRSQGAWVVAGQSISDVSKVQSTLLLPELLFGLLLALATFVGAFVVGLRASAPLEVVQRRQAEFTADASHELRTPLSVVEAEVDLALRRRRKPEEYEAVLRRIAGEGRRLRRIVDDLLWLARIDSGNSQRPQDQRADVDAVAADCTARFQALAERNAVDLVFRSEGQGRALIEAPVELIDRLAGVLVDNACKYAGRGGTALVTVRFGHSHVVLGVEDSGPGIPLEQRSAIFDRFRRATSEAGGSGLGLAIADSVVHVTGGSWSVGDSPLGGARMEVSWRRVAERNGPSAPGGFSGGLIDRGKAMDPVTAPLA